MILSNQVMCRNCGDTPYSAHRHDFKYCACGFVAVDGGMDYLRRLGNIDYMEELSIIVSDEDYDKLVDAIENPSKNTLGKLCHLARVLRDDMGIVLESKEETTDGPI